MTEAAEDVKQQLPDQYKEAVSKNPKQRRDFNIVNKALLAVAKLWSDAQNQLKVIVSA